MDQFYTAPPVTRTLVAGTLGVSLSVFGGLLDFRRIVFYPPWIFTFPPEIWRFVTPFLLTGGGLNLLLDPYFLYTYGSALETASSRFSAPGDFFVYTVFMFTVIEVTAGVFLGDLIFLPAFILGLAYTYAQDKRGGQVTFYVIRIPVIWLPWAMLALALAQGGSQALLSHGTGIIAAHAYEFLTRIYPSFGGGRNWIQTPAIVRRWFGGDRRSQTIRGYGTAFRPGAQQPRQVGNGRGWSSGLSSVWNGRGPGRRLGGD